MNPYRDKATQARAYADKLSGKVNTAHDEAMKEAFPIGAGFGRGSMRSRERKLEGTINRAVKAGAAKRKAEYLERMAELFDAGKVTAQGRPVREKEPKVAHKDKPRPEGPRVRAYNMGGGHSFCDRWHHDLKQVAFLPHHSEELQVFGKRPNKQVLEEVHALAKELIANRK